MSMGSHWRSSHRMPSTLGTLGGCNEHCLDVGGSRVYSPICGCIGGGTLYALMVAQQTVVVVGNSVLLGSGMCCIIHWPPLKAG